MIFRQVTTLVPWFIWTLVLGMIGNMFLLPRLGMAATPPILAATTQPHMTAPQSAFVDNVEKSALLYLEEQGLWKQARSIKTSSGASTAPSTPPFRIELLHRSTIQSPGGYKIVTFQPHVDNLPITNRTARVYLDKHDRPVFSTGSLELPAASSVETIPALDSPQKAAVAARNILGITPSQLRGDPLVVRMNIADQDLIHAAWQVVLPLTTYRDVALIFSASTGRLLSAGPINLDARGRVYASSPAVSSLIETELPDLYPDEGRLMGSHAQVFSCLVSGNACEAGVQAVPDAQGNYLFSPQLSNATAQDPFAEVQAYYHVNRIKHYLMGLGLEPSQLPEFPVVVNIPGMANAAYSPYDGALLFGVWYTNFAYDSDVVYHEYVHATIDQINPMDIRFDYAGINYIPAAMNEGMADTFSSLLAGDPILGEYVGGGQGIRRMDGNKTCPEDQIGMLHDDGMLWGQTAWELRDILGDDEEARGALLWDVLNLVEPEEGFKSFAQVTVDVATERFGEEVALQVSEIMERRGLFECGRVVTLEPGRYRDGINLSAGDLFSSSEMNMAVPGFLQFKVVVPKDTQYIQVEFGAITSGLEPADYRLYMRRNAPVGIDINNYGTMRVEADKNLTSFGGRFDVMGDFGGNLIPGDYYFATINDDNDTYQFSIRHVLVPVEQEDPDVGVEPADVGVDDEWDGGDEADGALMDGSLDDAESDMDGAVLLPSKVKADEGCACSVVVSGKSNSQGAGSGMPGFVLLLAGLAVVGMVVSVRRRR